MRASTVLTNLQRGNIPTMQTTVIEPVTVAGPHQRAGQGELTSAEITNEVGKRGLYCERQNSSFDTDL